LSVQRAIVVFGCRIDEQGAATPALVRRLDTAFRLWQAHPEAYLLVTGGAWGDRPSEAHVMEAWLKDRGVPEGRIVREPLARHTLDNAMQTVPLLVKLSVSSATIVTEQYHLRRSLLNMRFALQRLGANNIHVDAVAAPDRLDLPRRGAMAVRELFALARDVLIRSRAQP
jgi:uncharacterized SAM-binding protein YcdF (DUF218 family)